MLWTIGHSGLSERSLRILAARVNDNIIGMYECQKKGRKREEQEMGLFLGPEKLLPLLLYHQRLARCLATIQIILGVAVTSLSLWLLLWAPHLPVTDNPYWSGIPVSDSRTRLVMTLQG